MYFSRIFYMVPTLSWDRFLPKNGLWSGHIYFKSSWCLRHDDSYFDVSGAPNNINCIIVVLRQVGPGSKILRRPARKMPKAKYSGNIRKYCFVSHVTILLQKLLKSNSFAFHLIPKLAWGGQRLRSESVMIIWHRRTDGTVARITSRQVYLIQLSEATLMYLRCFIEALIIYSKCWTYTRTFLVFRGSLYAAWVVDKNHCFAVLFLDGYRNVVHVEDYIFTKR